MKRRVQVKICGLTEEAGVAAAIEAGADFLGMVFFPPSPRCIPPARAAELMDGVPAAIKRVGLFVDADDRALERVLSEVRLDVLQFHGAESPERIEAVRRDFATPVMKALGIEGAADLDQAKRYLDVADRLMFDAKPPKDATRPGGNAKSFDWTLLAGRKWKLPWMLAGGLTVRNVAEAIRASGAPAVDVSSGVETSPGIKDPEKVRAFITAARGG
jgi:phosphoribosylanthranilate isomerase